MKEMVVVGSKIRGEVGSGSRFKCRRGEFRGRAVTNREA